MMKNIFLLTFVLLVGASAFISSSNNSARTETAPKALADRIFGLDLFAPVKDQNDYGARKNKNLKVGSITDKSYIPSGLSKAEYQNIRKTEKSIKDKNYSYNVKKAFQFTDYTEWYTKRGTDLNGAWKKAVTLGHSMAKTKYDWSGVADAKKFESTTSASIFGKKPAVVAKKAPMKKKAPSKIFKTFRNY